MKLPSLDDLINLGSEMVEEIKASKYEDEEQRKSDLYKLGLSIGTLMRIRRRLDEQESP